MLSAKENASLRKSRAPVGDWRKYNDGKGKAPHANPYANFQVGPTDQSLDIPKIPSHDKQKVKRRLSMKVDGTMGPEFGAMPSLPSGAMQMIAEHDNVSLTSLNQQFERPQARTRHKGSFSAPLADPNFDAYRYVISRLQQAGAADVEEFTTQLAALDERVDEDIKNNVNKSYEKILIVSNDLGSTEHELKTLKSTIGSLQEITNQMKEVAEARLEMEQENGKTGAADSRKDMLSHSVDSNNSAARRNRSSVMILEKRWVDELNSLFKHVEGAQKFLAAVPSRHVLAESGRWYELNAATWKPLQPCHLFILNDHVLIAANKRRRNNQDRVRSKLVAEQCWPIREVKLIEIPDIKNDANGKHTEKLFTLNFKFHGSSYIYQTDRKDQYIKIVSAVKKAQTQLRDITEQESLKQRKLRDSMSILSASDKAGKRNSNLLQDLSARIHTRTTNSSGMVRNLRNIDDMIDEIDINIAHHKFSEAAEWIRVATEQISERRKEIRNVKQSSEVEEEVLVLLDVLKMKLDQRQGQLESALVFEINDELNTTDDINEFIYLLRSLNLSSLAKENLLLARSKLILKLISEVEFEGDLPDYITQVSLVRFQAIKATILLYGETFPEPEYSSDIIKWCTEEVKKQAALLEKQLYGVKVDSPIHKKCIEITRKQAGDLKLSGLDVDFLLEPMYSK